MGSERAARSRGRAAKVAVQQSSTTGRKRKDTEDEDTVDVLHRITREEAACLESSRIAATAAMRAAYCCDCTSEICSVDGHYMRYLLAQHQRSEQRKRQQEVLQQQQQRRERDAAAEHPAAPLEAQVSAAAAAAPAAEAEAKVTSAAEPQLDRPMLLRLSGLKPHYDRLELDMAAIHATISELYSSGFAQIDGAAAQQAKQQLAAAQAALKAKHDAYRVLQRVFCSWLSTVLSTDEVFEVFRTWAGQSCGCVACDMQRAAGAAAQAAGDDVLDQGAAVHDAGEMFMRGGGGD